MITALKLVAAGGGGTVSFAVGTVTGPHKVQNFGFTPTIGGDKLPKLETSGSWENEHVVQSMGVHAEGRIAGTDAADYMTQRAALMAVLLPGTGIPTRNIHGTIYATFAGMAELHAGVCVETYTAPLGKESVLSTVFSIDWDSPGGYWFNAGGTAVRL